MPRGRPKGSGRQGSFQRYQLSLVNREFEAVREQARECGASLHTTFERLLKIGLILYKASKAGNPIIIRKKGEKDREVLIV